MYRIQFTRKAFSLILAFLILSNAFSQNNASTLGKVNIASPNASSLGKYGDIPVSYHTGVPNISIPIYSLKSGSLQLPVGLSYHAGGLRVEENDSWVGAGWTLNAGGAITRTVKDKPDEKQTSSLSQTHGHYSGYGFLNNYFLNGQQDESFFDSEPDLFFFNFNGYSGKFYFNDDRTPILVPEGDYKIECSYTPGIWTGSPGAWAGLGRSIESFTITTTDGTKYYFGIPSTVPVSPYCNPIEVSSTYTSQGGASYSQVISSWYLYKIVSADGNFSITLNYERDKFAFYSFSNAPVATMNNTGTNYKYTLVKTLMAGVRLSNIISSNESVSFTPGSVRQDLSRWASGLDETLTDYINESSKSLGSISISDNQGNCNKKFNFSYDYFVDNTSPVHTNFSGIISDKKRLKLLSVQEQSCDAAVSVPPYTFEYFTEQVPRKLSFSRDHWGYNNGVTTNTQLYPSLSDNNGVLNTTGNLDIANRESSWPAMRAGTLSKITYPTGGNTSLNFEANTFYVIENSVNVEKTIGGLRIKTLTNFDPAVNKSIVTNYSYQSSGLSSGVLYSKPTYIQVFRNDWYKKNNTLGNPNGNGCWDIPSWDANNIQYRSYIFSDNPLRPMETTQGSHIGYSEVKVTQTGNGFSVYRFSVTPPWQINHDKIAITSVVNPCSCDLTIPNYPAAPVQHDFYRGEPTFEGHYNESGQVLSEKIFSTSYQENPVTVPGRLTYSFNTGSAFTAETFYELKTAKKTQSTVIEKNYQAGGSSNDKQVQTFFESNYHHEPTRILTTNSTGQTIEKKIKYAFDYRVPVFENTSTCNSYAAAGFINYANSLYISGGYQTQFMSCAGYANSCFSPIITSYFAALSTSRKNYIDCRKTNYTNTSPLNAYQTNHNTAKTNADAELKPILWMQDINMNAPVEVTEWNNGKLTAASFTKYSNNRDDEFGIYPDKTFKIDLASPSSTYTASVVSPSNISITKDSRYADLSQFDFNLGNVINTVSREGVPTAYQWGYNQSLPVAKLVNASNKFKESSQPGSITKSPTFQLGPSNPVAGSPVTFTQVQSGTITVSLPTPPPSAQVTATFNLTGPVNQSGNLCAAGSGAASCNTIPSILSYSNMPAGQYTLDYTVSTSFGSYTFNYSLSYTYIGMAIVTSGLKEFFFESFEENISAVTGNAHTGTKYSSSNYTTAFSLPNARAYTIQWWNFANNKWTLNSQPFTANITLTGPVDDIRIFPTDAFITTYTYNPLKGITSETEPNGKSIFYEYDALNRLSSIRDYEGKILKKLCYTYAGQVENCSAVVFSSVEKSGVFTRNNCSAGYSGTSVTYTVAAGAYTSLISQADADALAQADVNANGQSYANTNGTCVQLITVTGSNSKNKIYTVSFYNTATSTNYSFTLNAFASNVTLGQVPSGVYNVSFSPQGSPITATFNVNGFIQSGVGYATFSNISVTAATTVSVN